MELGQGRKLVMRFIRETGNEFTPDSTVVLESSHWLEDLVGEASVGKPGDFLFDFEAYGNLFPNQ